jgi:hypothetical protein
MTRPRHYLEALALAIVAAQVPSLIDRGLSLRWWRAHRHTIDLNDLSA